MHNFIDSSYTIFQRIPFCFRKFAARESTDILESDEELTPTVCERRRERIAWKNGTQRAKAPAVTPGLDQTLQRAK